jgi:hypothetical protein
MWSTGLVTELRKSRDGLIRSVTLRTPNGNSINRAIQCLYPLEVRVDDPEDLDFANGEDLDITDGEREPEDDPAPPESTHSDPTLPEPAVIESDVDPVVEDVEPNSTGSSGEYVGNRITHPTATTRSGRVSSLIS